MKPESSKTSIAREKAVRQKVVNPTVSNSVNAGKCPKKSGDSADVRKTTVRRNSDIPVSSNSGNSTKCTKKATSSVEEKKKISQLRSKTPTRSQSKRTVQPKKNSEHKIDDKGKNSKCSTKNKTTNFFNSKESCQAKENETRSHLSQKESGATRKAPLARNSQSKNNSCSVSKPIPGSKEGKLEKCVEARRGVYPKKIEPNKSILKGKSKSDLNLNIDRLSEEKNSNKNFRKVSDSAFESGMKKVSFKYSSVNDLNRRRCENAVKKDAEEGSIFRKLKMPFYEEFCDELEDSNCIDDLFFEQGSFEDSFSDGSILNEQLQAPEKYEKLFISKNNENLTPPLKHFEKITSHNKQNMRVFDLTVDEKASILTDPRKTRIPFYVEDAMQFTKNHFTVLSPRHKNETGVQLNDFSKNINDNDQRNLLDPFGSLINKEEHNYSKISEISETPLIDFGKATDEYFSDCITHQSQNIDGCTSGQKENYKDCISKQKENFQGYDFGNTSSDKKSYNTQCLVEEEKDKMSQLSAGFSYIPTKCNNNYLKSTEFISSDPISGDNSSPKVPENNTLLKKLSKRDLIEKSIEEKIRILKKQFLKQIKTQNKNYYIFQKKIENPRESSNDFVSDTMICNSNSLNAHNHNRAGKSKSTAIHTSSNEKSEKYFSNQEVILNSSDAVHCYEVKKKRSSLSNLLLEYYDQHIKSPSTLSKTSYLQRDTLISSFTIPSPETFKACEKVEGATEELEIFCQNREECKDILPNSSTVEEFLKSIASEDLEHNSEIFDIFNELDSVRKFDDFFGKAVIDEETLREVLESYFLDEENNCPNQLKPSEDEERTTRNSQINSNSITKSTASYVFLTIPLAITVFLLFTCIVRYFQIDNESIDL